VSDPYQDEAQRNDQVGEYPHRTAAAGARRKHGASALLPHGNMGARAERKRFNTDKNSVHVGSSGQVRGCRLDAYGAHSDRMFEPPRISFRAPRSKTVLANLLRGGFLNTRARFLARREGEEIAGLC